MLCIRCQTPNPDTSRFCSECGEPFHSASQHQATAAPSSTGEVTRAPLGGTSQSMAVTTAGTGSSASVPGVQLGLLARGHLLGNRYEIEEPLGMGGMGMVYRARDRELNVPVALKLIRAEYMDNERILERFKQEITIARRVTHRNVARIFDIGEAEGLRYISMEYIEGEDLAHLVEKKGPLSIEQTLSILRQICEALKEAHASGVVHRDLKPHNVMLDANGSAHVMDFGIAMSADVRGMTRTGALIGTPDYMSPEQAGGHKVDHRSDIYSLGITLYEILAGDAPFKGDTTWEVIKKQIEQQPQSIRKSRGDVPAWLDTLILKCLEKDPALRYQSVGEILADLDRQEAHLSARHYIPSRRVLTMAGAAVLLVIAAVGITMLVRPKVPVAGTGGRRSVAILPFENQTGRADLDWLRTGLADNLTTDLAESKYFRVLSRERLTQIFHELGLTDTSKMDAAALKRIGEFGAVEAVVTGSFLGFGDEIRVNLKVQDPKTGEIFKSKALNRPEKEVLGMIDELTRTTKQMFELAPERLAGDADLEIASSRTSSIQSASLYQKGVDLLLAGQNLEAIAPLQQAVRADKEFAMAHARLAEAYMRIGHDREASDESREAMTRLLAQAEKIPQADRTFIRALNGRISHQPEESIRAYEEMLKADPDDPAVAFALGEVIEETGDFTGAEQRYVKALEHDPKNPALKIALGRARIKSGNSEAALPELQAALDLYKQMGSEEGQGYTLNAMGRAYDTLGRFEEALDYYGRSEALRRAIGDKRGLAGTLDNKGGLLQLKGRLAEAVKNEEEALGLSREIGDTDQTATILTNLGSLEEERGAPEGSIKYYTEALDLRRTLKNRAEQITCLCSLSRGLMQLGSLPQAEQSLEEAEKIARELEDEEGIVQVMSDQALLSYLRGDLGRAIEGQEKAVSLWDKTEREDGVAEARYRLGLGQQTLSRYGPARVSLGDSLKKFEKLGDRTNVTRVSLALARTALTIGDLPEATSLLDKMQAGLTSLDNPTLLAQSRLLRATLLLRSNDTAGARSAAEEACRQADRSRAVMPAVQCGLAKALTAASPDEATSQGLVASTRAADSGFLPLAAEVDVALAKAYEKAGRPEQAAARARLAYDAARKMGLSSITLAAAPLVAKSLWGSGKRDAALSTLAEAIEGLDAMGKGLDADGLIALRSSEDVKAATSMIAGYLKSLGRNEEAAAYLARSSS